MAGLVGAIVAGAAQGASAEDKKKKEKVVTLENGLAFVDKNKRDGMLAGLEQSVGKGDFVIVDYVAYLKDGKTFSYEENLWTCYGHHCRKCNNPLFSAESCFSGTIFDNTKKRGKPVAFQVGKKQVIPGLEIGLVGMKVCPSPTFTDADHLPHLPQADLGT